MAQQAWYKRYEEVRDEALRYVKSVKTIAPNSLQRKELQGFAARADVRLIFESNTIEKAGTKTEGETQVIVRQYSTRFPQDVGFTDVAKNTSELALIGSEAQYRREREVLQHKAALILACSPNVDDRSFITEARICAIHRTLAEGLMPSDADVEAGEYRVHGVGIVGSDVVFPAPELIPPAMQRFVEMSNKRVSDILSGGWTDCIMVAAEVSYNFVRIHPFPDFNGRMSRLLLAMTLCAFGVPFSLALRGSNAKSRHRYFFALQRADTGDLKPYATLIAMRLVESFREIDENLRLAGRKALLELE
jgi:Fic family protein